MTEGENTTNSANKRFSGIGAKRRQTKKKREWGEKKGRETTARGQKKKQPSRKKIRGATTKG